MPLAHVLVTDDRQARPDTSMDVVLWVGHRPAPARLRSGARVIERRTVRGAASYLAPRQAELHLRLREPLSFLGALAAAASGEALRAA